MIEKRRLLIDQDRLGEHIDSQRQIALTNSEMHYLSRVMRMKKGHLVDIVDGKGHLWNAEIEEGDFLKLTTNLNSPLQTSLREKPLICLAVSIPKKGFENVLQMCCEIGVDVIQPLISQRSIVKDSNNVKDLRWKKIIYEAVEQSERLWCPELRQVLKLQNWLNNYSPDSHIAFANPRIDGLKDCVEWLNQRPLKINEVWIAIGPEGGWNKYEQSLASDSGFDALSMGETILRTSTAAVGACQLMTSWRRLRSSIDK